MTTDRSVEYLTSLVRELCKLPRETEWVEFKVNNADPQEIGEYLAALANAAALNGKAFAYLVWGVEDQTRHIVGTRFSPATSKKSNEPLETWLLRSLLPSNEVIGQALRKTVPMFPELAVRELVANALIHQDFFVTGTGPMKYVPYWA